MPTGRAAAPTSLREFTAELIRLGERCGLDAVGIAPANPFVDTRRHLEERRSAGLHAGMKFTYSDPAVATDPGATVPGAQAVVVGALGYARAGAVPSGDRGGVVARYAREDHYRALRGVLSRIADRLRADGWRSEVLVDDNRLVDREAAYQAGLGWYGKNTNLLIPGRGSWFVLGSVITDAPLSQTGPPRSDGCGSCSKCLPACPTGALTAPGVLDARRCLAWLLQAKGTFPLEFRAALGGRVYGCDDCQEACPPSRVELRRAEDAPGDDQSQVDIAWLLTASDGEILERVGRWYIPGRKVRYVRRNALVALGNVGRGGDNETVELLRRYLTADDALLRAHAVWAAYELGRHDLLNGMRAGERDPGVLEELDRAGA